MFSMNWSAEHKRVWWSALVGVLMSPVVAMAAAPALFLFELGGAPVGTVELDWDRAGGQYVYTSTQLFSREGDHRRRTRVARFEVDDVGRDLRTGRHLETLVLWRGPGPLSEGARCVEAIEELGGRTGRVCFNGDLKGSVFGEAFTARYDADGLRSLELGPARFTRVPRGTEVPLPPDVFARGFPVPAGEGALALEPPLEVEHQVLASRPAQTAHEARALALEVTASFSAQRASGADFAHDPEATAASCLGHALRYRERAKRRGFDAEIVHGLVVFDGESVARPHAWVRVALEGGGALDLDPTLDVEVRPSSHLALTVVKAAGEGWLRLLSGRHRVVRR